ncbi:SMP-30/gluconolactonase/LRE family protein [Sphingopyxis kveilinensis]|uniref:SMP-30/gluconolactonase/LRE family protein n=1 Tax=Sphingopyxis kveilinensis TaxID=3114367 RepID=UPI0030D0DB4C
MELTAQCVWEARTELGEGAIWVGAERALYYVDGLGGRILRYDEREGGRTVFQYDGTIGFIARRAEGGLIAGIDNRLCAVDIATGEVKEIAFPEPDLPESRFNDAKVDMRGRLWAGTLDRECRADVGALYRLDPDHSLHKMDSGYFCTNGPAFSPDGKILYHTDSLKRTIYQFDLDTVSGALGERRVFVVLRDDQGMPDGMTVDASGRVWVAQFGGAGVTAYNPDGSVYATVSVPSPNVTTCAFGGDDGSTLFIATSLVSMTEEQKAHYPLAGGLFAVAGLAGGLPAFDFQG